jgi:hypothetical protein
MASLSTKFHKNLQIGSRTERGADRCTDKMVISLAYIFPLGSKVGCPLNFELTTFYCVSFSKAFVLKNARFLPRNSHTTYFF